MLRMCRDGSLICKTLLEKAGAKQAIRGYPSWALDCIPLTFRQRFMSKDLSPSQWGLPTQLFKTHNREKRRGEKKKKNLKSSCADLGTYITPNYHNFSLQASPSVCKAHENIYSATEECIMPVCPHDWRKHSCSFCPAESCCIMGVLKALGSERACLTKPRWLAADRRVCLRAGCQKLIFRRFSVDAVAAAWQCEVLDILASGGGLGLRYVALLWRSRELVGKWRSSQIGFFGKHL